MTVTLKSLMNNAPNYLGIWVHYPKENIPTNSDVNISSLFPINALDHWRGWSVSTIDKAKRKISAI